ncbi:MAG: F0F1 ATP synthase subunit A [Acidobacteriia bacterium]|nr:F0F1 ATP synthase subunit A [Methyloceanibacter sp.]MCL6492532.1 F0F1 ATP synthase subunit A [Terriglobia bacterium]
MAAEKSTIDALGQFHLDTALGPIGQLVNFTNSNVMMVVAALLVFALIHYGMRARALVPSRLQSMAEMGYEFIYNMCIDQIGEEGVRFFPFIFALFFFILAGNLLGLFPYFFTFTSHIAVTGALAILVIVLVTVVGLRIHGLHFFSYFFPEGAPVALAPLIVPIEVISYLSRPVSLSIRLFANMTAGHVMLEVLASFMLMMAAGLGVLGVAAALGPLAINVVLIGFELLVATLQAYVFALLTCIYLHDAVHLH